MTHALGINVKKVYTEADATNAGFSLLSTSRQKSGLWVFVKASGTVAQYGAVKIDNDGTAAALTTTLSGSEPTMVGVAQLALVANDYAWVWVGEGGGTGFGIKVLVAASCATDVKLYTTATAGVLDDANSSVDLIQGLTIVTANGGTQAAVECFSPLRLATNCQD